MPAQTYQDHPHLQRHTVNLRAVHRKYLKSTIHVKPYSATMSIASMEGPSCMLGLRSLSQTHRQSRAQPRSSPPPAGTLWHYRLYLDGAAAQHDGRLSSRRLGGHICLVSSPSGGSAVWQLRGAGAVHACAALPIPLRGRHCHCYSCCFHIRAPHRRYYRCHRSDEPWLANSQDGPVYSASLLVVGAHPADDYGSGVVSSFSFPSEWHPGHCLLSAACCVLDARCWLLTAERGGLGLTGPIAESLVGSSPRVHVQLREYLVQTAKRPGIKPLSNFCPHD